MSKRHNIEMVGLSTAHDERQRLVREIEALEREDDESFRAARALRRAAGHENNNGLLGDSPSAARKRALCIEGAVADPELSTVQRAIAREEHLLKVFARGEKERRRIAELLVVTEDRAYWAQQLIERQESDERETMTLLFASQVVETQRKEREREQREKMDAAVQQYLEERELIDDLHSSMLEDRWMTREKVLREAAENREAGRQVAAEWKRTREHVFLDEDDLFQ